MRLQEFPMFRLATLLARQASSPIATRIKEYASTHPWFSRRVCMGAGRVFHAAQVRARLWALALRQPARLPPLSDAAALEAGATLLGEAVIFGLGSLIIIFEVNRQAVNKQNKKLDVVSEWMAVRLQLEELQREVEAQQQDIVRLMDELRLLAPEEVPSPQPPAPATPPPTRSPPPAGPPVGAADAPTTEAPPPPPETTKHT